MTTDVLAPDDQGWKGRSIPALFDFAETLNDRRWGSEPLASRSASTSSSHYTQLLAFIETPNAAGLPLARNIALAFANRIADPRSAAEHRQLIVSSLDAAVELAVGHSDTGKLMQARNAARKRVEQCKAAAQDWAKRPM